MEGHDARGPQCSAWCSAKPGQFWYPKSPHGKEEKWDGIPGNPNKRKLKGVFFFYIREMGFLRDEFLIPPSFCRIGWILSNFEMSADDSLSVHSVFQDISFRVVRTFGWLEGSWLTDDFPTKGYSLLHIPLGIYQHRQFLICFLCGDCSSTASINHNTLELCEQNKAMADSRWLGSLNCFERGSSRRLGWVAWSPKRREHNAHQDWLRPKNTNPLEFAAGHFETHPNNPKHRDRRRIWYAPRLVIWEWKQVAQVTLLPEGTAFSSSQVTFSFLQFSQRKSKGSSWKCGHLKPVMVAIWAVNVAWFQLPRLGRLQEVCPQGRCLWRPFVWWLMFAVMYFL